MNDLQQQQIATAQELAKQPGAEKAKYWWAELYRWDHDASDRASVGFGLVGAAGNPLTERIGPYFPVEDGDPWSAAAVLERMVELLGATKKQSTLDIALHWLGFKKYELVRIICKLQDKGYWELAANMAILAIAKLKPELFQQAMEHEA